MSRRNFLKGGAVAGAGIIADSFTRFSGLGKLLAGVKGVEASPAHQEQVTIGENPPVAILDKNVITRDELAFFDSSYEKAIEASTGVQPLEIPTRYSANYAIPETLRAIDIEQLSDTFPLGDVSEKVDNLFQAAKSMIETAKAEGRSIFLTFAIDEGETAFVLREENRVTDGEVANVLISLLPDGKLSQLFFDPNRNIEVDLVEKLSANTADKFIAAGLTKVSEGDFVAASVLPLPANRYQYHRLQVRDTQGNPAQVRLSPEQKATIDGQEIGVTDADLGASQPKTFLIENVLATPVAVVASNERPADSFISAVESVLPSREGASTLAFSAGGVFVYDTERFLDEYEGQSPRNVLLENPEVTQRVRETLRQQASTQGLNLDQTVTLGAEARFDVEGEATLNQVINGEWHIFRVGRHFGTATQEQPSASLGVIEGKIVIIIYWPNLDDNSITHETVDPEITGGMYAPFISIQSLLRRETGLEPTSHDDAFFVLGDYLLKSD